MDGTITENGTVTVTPPPGRYILSLTGTPAVGTVVALKHSESAVAITNRAGNAIQITGGNLPEPVEIPVAGELAFVTTDIVGSTDLAYAFRRLPSC